MSFDKIRPRKSPSIVKTHSGLIRKAQEQTSAPEYQSVIINFYPGNSSKQTDKNIQTESELRPDLEESVITRREYLLRRDTPAGTHSERQQLNLQLATTNEKFFRKASDFFDTPTTFSISCHLEKPSPSQTEKAPNNEKSPCPSQESQYFSKETLYHPGKSSCNTDKLPHLPKGAFSEFDKALRQVERSDQQEKYSSKESQCQLKDSEYPSEEPLYQSVELSEVTSEYSMFNEKKEDFRKYYGSDGKSKISGREASDLERRRLEVELKAAEEIAQIKQTIIEKRLALELASIDDSDQTQDVAKSQAEIKCLEELALRKQSLIETHMAQEMQTLDYQRLTTPPRSNPPSPRAQPASSPSKLSNFSAGSPSFIKGGGILDKKFNWDSRFSGTKPANYFTQEKKHQAAQEARYLDGRDYPQWRPQEKRQDYSPENRYYDHQAKTDNAPNWPSLGQADPAYQYQGRMGSGRAKTNWKTVMLRIVKKIRNRPPEE